MTGNSNRMTGNSNRRAAARASFAALAFAFLLLAFAAPALAGPPTHLRTADLDLIGAAPDPGPTHPAAPFNQACGTAVDSRGDVYVASAGNDVVDVFNAAHEYLTSIANANDPCGLAVDSNGTLFVTEKATGKVVRYVPDEYPFVGTPSYAAPETIDGSGSAKGIAVDTTLLLTNSNFVIGGDDSLYIAKGDHVDAYSNETQRIQVNASGGTFKLTFEGQETAPLPYNVSHAEVQAALENLSTLGAGNVSVTTGNFAATDHLITFTHALGLANVSQIEVDTTNLTGGGVSRSETNGGFLATIGSGGPLTDATGVAAYTYRVTSEQSDRYVFAADGASDQVKVFSGPSITSLKLRRTIEGVDHDGDPETPDQKLGFSPAGAYLAVDPGNKNASDECSSIDEQACTAGHLLVYDEAHEAVDEFDASGEFLDQIPSPEPPFSFEDAEPTALAVERSGGANDGTLYVTAGASTGAKVLAFGPLMPPSRPPLAALSQVLEKANSVAVDSKGNVYVAVAAELKIRVYDPAGNEIEVGPKGEGIPDVESPYDLAVDSSGKVFVLDQGPIGSNGEEKVTYYTPDTAQPEDGTQYTRHEPPCATRGSLGGGGLESIGINPANDHLFVTAREASVKAVELDSAANECAVLDPDFVASGLVPIHLTEIAAYGANGNVYLAQQGGTITVVDPSGSEVLARITGAGSPKGLLEPNSLFAVDQANGHVLVFHQSRGVAEEYDGAGGFVAEFGNFSSPGYSKNRIAIDNSGRASDGNVYVAYDGPAPGTFDLTAFGPLTYGEGPIATTGIASGVGGGNATLNGTVDPRGFDLEDCHFDYLTDAQYLANGETFAGAIVKPCADLAAIGKGIGPVPVHADITDLDLDLRYRFRLLARNKYGESVGKAGLFGPPLATSEEALPILYDEATLRGTVDPSGLATSYRFEYGTSEAYGQSTPAVEIPPGVGSVAVEAALTGLAEGTVYHFRLVAENEAKVVPGTDESFETLQRATITPCPNTEFRTGLSASLPDCRAYELVTPPDTRGVLGPMAVAISNAGEGFSNWSTQPRGEGAGESVAFLTGGTLPGFDGNGHFDGYRAERGEGEHPAEGWTSALIGPTYAQTGGGPPSYQGIASDQRYLFWAVSAFEVFEGTLPAGNYLRTPSGVEPVGQGSLGTDLGAEGRYVTGGGTHVIFDSDKHLEPGAPPQGTTAIYDRTPGGPTHVVSLPSESASAGEKAGFEAAQASDLGTSYQGASDDGSTVVFKVGATMYARDDNARTEVVTRDRVAVAGEQLDCAQGPDGVDPDQPDVEWLRNGVPIPLEDDDQYTTALADAGTAVQCRISVQVGNTGSVWVSNPAILVKPVPATEPPQAPEVIPAPTPPNPGVGTEATCDPGAWTGATGPFAYQWYVDGDPVPGATSEAYVIQAADVPGAIQCSVTASNAGGSTAKVSAIANTNPPPNPPAPVAYASADLHTAFAGISDDGERVFYATGGGITPGRLFSFDLDLQVSTEIAANSIFANVPAADPAIESTGQAGSHVYFASKLVLDDAGEGVAGEDNLYFWDGSSEKTRFIAVLDPQDLESFDGDPVVDLARWAEAVRVGVGRAQSPTRSTPDGKVLVFQSHAQLTSYDNEGFGEIYRYDSAAAPGEQLTCVSCDPAGSPPSADATLMTIAVSSVNHQTLIPNLTEDGGVVFFESDDPLLPEDANSVQDVYEWKVQGEGCKRAGGCLALISSGQGEHDSNLFGMTADGHDVFFRTLEKLHGADIPGSSSIYDARVEGGIPDPPAAAPCQGDACQGQGSLPPALPAPASTGSGVDNAEPKSPLSCPKGKRKVRRNGKARCVKRHGKKQHRTRHHRKGRAAR